MRSLKFHPSFNIVLSFVDVKNEEFNKHFWEHLQDEWKKRVEQSEDQSPWLGEFSEFYDPYKVS